MNHTKQFIEKKRFPVRVAELDSNTRMTVWWTESECEFADHLARTGGFCYVDGFGYFYRLKDLQNAIAKAYETDGDYWREKIGDDAGIIKRYPSKALEAISK